MKVGYVTASNRVMRDGKPVGYLYREKPDNPNDSGWRIFAGDETQEYADDPDNFALYNASALVEKDPTLLRVLGVPFPVAFERDIETGDFVKVEQSQWK